MATPQSGDRINNYILEEVVGEGSFGRVWRARHHIFDQHVAIKIPTDSQYVRNLQREGVVVHGLRHPNIVRVLDLDPYADVPYLIMEYVGGPSLREVLDSHPQGLPLDCVITIMRGLLNALATAHASSIIHRDVKPGNILLDCAADRVDEVTAEQVRVTDFGLGRIGDLTTASMMQSGSLLTEDGRSISGTLAYMSPEQRTGEEIDGQSDLYACGVVLYELLTGSLPQGADPPSSLRTDLPTYLDEVFNKCYTRRERRFENAAQMLAALDPRSHGHRWVHPMPKVGDACPSCGQSCRPDDQFCIRCGNQIVEVVPRCPACRAFVQKADRYCIMCGMNLQVHVP